MDKLKKKRGALKGRITRVCTFIEQLMPEVPIGIQDVKVRMTTLEESWTEYKDVHWHIIDLIDEGLTYSEEADYVEVEEKYTAAAVTLMRLVDELDNNSSSHQASGTLTSNNAQRSRIVADVKLPRMDLPIFSGNQLEWQSYRDLFKSIIHDNNKISGSQKLHYLKNSLHDEALGHRHCHLKSLFAQAAIQVESAMQLRKLADTTTKHIRALKTMGFETDHWDAIVVFLITDKLDPDSRRQWEISTPGKVYPTMGELKIFLDQRCRVLDTTILQRPKQVVKLPSGVSSSQRNNSKSYHMTMKPSCPVCKSDHYVSQCSELLKLDLNGRQETVKRLRLCFNCLKTNHSSKECKSEYRCKHCHQKHNTLLHSVTPTNSIQRKANNDHPSTSILSSHCNDHGSTTQVLLSTALVKVKDGFGNMQSCRVLLDSGSQATLITESCMRKLGLQRSKTKMSISGIGQSTAERSRGMVNLDLQSTASNFTINVNAIILRQITNELPSLSFNIDTWKYIENLNLADPTFNTPGPIDILIGADIFEQIIGDGKITGSTGMPSIRNTEFGWIFNGKVGSIFSNHVISHVAITDISDQLKKFWELEEVNSQHLLTTDEAECETQFKKTKVRDATGRFILSLPFRQDGNHLGLSKDMCVRRLIQVEKRLMKNPDYQEQYQKFMEQYSALGHMELIHSNLRQEIPTQTNYLPHHYVLKESSSTTSFRVVFDASAKTSTGISLNDKLLVGPRLQEDMYNIMLRFRIYKYAFTADIAKMYRQIQVTSSDADLQQILWRKSPSEPIEEFRLLTVTYGTASAPYMAVRTLQQLAEEEGNRFPLANVVTKRDFYVDDIMSGNNSLKTALILQKELIDMLQLGGMQLRKWSSNHSALLDSLPPEYRELTRHKTIMEDESIKALGIHWNTSEDVFFFKVNMPRIITIVTKRSILSETAKLYDPLGWLAPVIIIAKILLQKLWLLGVSWDEELPSNIREEWETFRSQLFSVEQLRIKRWIETEENSTHQLHGFSDASERAYSAVVFIRSKSNNNIITSHLITAKTREAPVKQVSIQRLELCGTVLLARLITKVKASLHIDIESIYTWTDSTITLAWLSSHPRKWTTFVANRVSEVQSLISPSCWHYISSEDNPADCASRGMLPDIILSFSLWWTGPAWLIDDETNWPQLHGNTNESHVTELKNTIHIGRTENVDKSFTGWDLMEKYSSLTKLNRVTAYCRRFVNNMRARSNNRQKSYLSPIELQQAMMFWITTIQKQEFHTMIYALKKGKIIKQEFMKLDPFIDEDGVLRVGGRLRLASIPAKQKHPILLPKNNHLTRLIIVADHINLLHAGPQQVLYTLQQRYWIVNGRSLVRQLIHKCVQCVRDRATVMNQKMGDLPRVRLESSRAFLKTGVDYAGPYNIKSMKGRGGKVTKAYISLFICMCTKAVHLELVSDLTSEAFLAALRRFIARRGKPLDIFSDNGTNFVGANSELKELGRLMRDTQFQKLMACSMADDGIYWHFIPARGPHFGGLWEAAIKSMKRHLRKVIGTQNLTFDELYTILTQVEACLNSRPLCSISTDPSDTSSLTPAHFLIGEPLTTTPEPSLMHLPMNRLSRWQLVQQISQHFWKRCKWNISLNYNNDQSGQL